MARQIDTAGEALIKSFEALRLKSYPDPGTGGAPWTVGWGSTRNVTPGMTITVEEAEQRFKADIAAAEDAVANGVRVPLNDNQFSALVSFTFNVGVKTFLKSSLLRSLNLGNYGVIGRMLIQYNHSAGKVVDGLTRRRFAEAALWKTPSGSTVSPTPDVQVAVNPVETIADKIIKGA